MRILLSLVALFGVIAIAEVGLSPSANATTVTPPAAATIAVTVAVPTAIIAAAIVATAIITTTIVCLLSNTRLFSFECLDTTGQRGCTCAWT